MDRERSEDLVLLRGEVPLGEGPVKLAAVQLGQSPKLPPGSLRGYASGGTVAASVSVVSFMVSWLFEN